MCQQHVYSFLSYFLQTTVWYRLNKLIHQSAAGASVELWSPHNDVTPPESIHHIRSRPRWQLDNRDLIEGQNWFWSWPSIRQTDNPHPLLFFPGLKQTLQQLFSPTFNRRTGRAGLIRETSCCCGGMRWKPADSWTARTRASGSEVRAGRLKVRAFHLYQLFFTDQTPTHPHACHRSSTGNRRQEGTNKPGYVTRDKTTRRDETDARAGVWTPSHLIWA